MASPFAAEKFIAARYPAFFFVLGAGYLHSQLRVRGKSLAIEEVQKEGREARVVELLNWERQFYLRQIEELRREIAARGNQKNITRDVGVDGQVEVGGLSVA